MVNQLVITRSIDGYNFLSPVFNTLEEAENDKTAKHHHTQKTCKAHGDPADGWMIWSDGNFGWYETEARKVKSNA